MWPNPQKTEDLVTFTEEIIDQKLHFMWSADYNQLFDTQVFALFISGGLLLYFNDYCGENKNNK